MTTPTEKKPKTSATICASFLALALSAGALNAAYAGAAPSYPKMAPIEQYRMSRAGEISLAREAAPASISNDANIMVMGAHSYETAVKGKNGFVCLVMRSWDNGFDDAEFWNQKIRAPICYNPIAVRDAMPEYLKRTEWALSGVSKDEMLRRIEAMIAAKEIVAPEAGAMSYMMSKDSYLGDAAGGHWHPHLMLFLPPMPPSEWGANLTNSPVLGEAEKLEPLTMFFIPMPVYSDGTVWSKHMWDTKTLQ